MHMLLHFEKSLGEWWLYLIRPHATVVDDSERNRCERASAFLLAVASGTTIVILLYLIVSRRPVPLLPAQVGLLFIPGVTFFEYWLARRGRHVLAAMIFILLATPAILMTVLGAPQVFSPLNGLYFTSVTVLFAKLVYGWKVGFLALLYNSAAMLSAYWLVEGLRLDEILLGPVFFQGILYLVLIVILFLERKINKGSERGVVSQAGMPAPQPVTAGIAAVESASEDFSAQEQEALFQKIRDQQETIAFLQQKLRTQYQILDQLPIGVFAKDDQGRHLLANRSLAHRVGREPRDIIHRPDDELMPPEQARLYRAEDEQLLYGMRETVRSELNYLSTQGENRVMRSQKWPLRDEDGQVVGVIGISEDITDERQRENTLEVSRHQIALLFEHSPLAIIEWNIDGIITNWNPAAERMFGVSREDALGSPLEALVLAKDARDYAENLRRLFRRDRALVALGSIPSAVVRSQHKDEEGQTFARDWTFTILTQTQGVVTGFGAIVSDVTAQVRAQEQLERALERLDTFVQQVPVAIIEWDVQRIIQRWNPAAETIFGWTAAEAIGREALELMVPDTQRPVVEGVFTRMINGSAPVFSENANIRRDGTQIICQWINIPLINHLDQRIGLISVAQDVTIMHRSHEQALALTAHHARMVTLKQFVQRVSHYFRNHLAQIEVNRHLMLRSADKKDSVRLGERLGLLKQSVQRMAEQLDNLNMLSSIAVIEEQRVDLISVTQSAFNLLHREAQERALQYVFDPPDENLIVLVDPTALRDALRRLLNNAIAYTPPNGTVVMRAGRQGEQAVVEVEDNGIGMTEEQAENAFELFYRADAASSLETGGLGLGLNIARMIVENHKGTISVRSSLGKGSTFVVRLPLVLD